MAVVSSILGIILQLYLFVLIGRMVLSFVPVFIQGWEPRGALLVVAEAIYSLTDPPLRALRKVFRPVRVGNVAFDVAFIVLMVLLSVLMAANRMFLATL